MFGLEGSEVISDTEEHTGNFIRLKALTDCEIAAITTTMLTGNDIVGEVIPESDSLDVHFTAITLASGTAVATKIS